MASKAIFCCVACGTFFCRVNLDQVSHKFFRCEQCFKMRRSARWLHTIKAIIIILQYKNPNKDAFHYINDISNFIKSHADYLFGTKKKNIFTSMNWTNTVSAAISTHRHVFMQGTEKGTWRLTDKTRKAIQEEEEEEEKERQCVTQSQNQLRYNPYKKYRHNKNVSLIVNEKRASRQPKKTLNHPQCRIKVDGSIVKIFFFK